MEYVLLADLVSYGTPVLLIALMLLQVYELTQLRHITTRLDCLDAKKVNKETCAERHHNQSKESR